MQIDLFKVPIWIGNIETEKINLNYSEPQKTWKYCDTFSSLKLENKIEAESANYLLSTIDKLIKPFFKIYYKLELLNIWVNKYNEKDFQEPHIHVNSSLSFIIYKKVNQSYTVFKNPQKYLIEYSGLGDYLDMFFEPECRENQIVIFPSFLEHFVRKNSNSITLAGNLKIDKLT
tara:strand:- start:1514 stop:2035 length:522 start_codon:yes stop_codon:yes gene_type:complete